MYHKALSLLLFSSLLLTSFAHHVLDDEIPCIHDQLDHNPEMLDIEEDFSPADEGRDRRLSSNPNIRIYPYFDFLDSRTSSSFASYIRNDLVPPIIDYFQAALKVKYPVTGQLKLGSSVSKICERSTPSILRSGVDADFFMYYDIDTATSFVASAKYCHLASGSKRPLVARTSINTNRLSNAKDNVLVHEKNMYVLMHEMMHAMGFSNWLTKYYLDENGRTRTGHIKNVNIAGSTRTVIDVPPLTERLRNFYGCSSLQGAIMENQGGDGTALTHFERKYFLYESMTSGSIFGRRISEFSWAMLEGSGWYEVDYSYAEPYFYGKGKGCDFISTTCSNAASKFEEEYCTGSNRGCSPEGGGGGSCQSDSIMDGCRFYYPNEYQDCDNDDGYDNARLPDLQVYGRGAGSKCFTGTLNTRQSSNGKTSFCFKYTCVGSGSDTQVEVQVGNNRVTCTRKGTQTIDGYYGAVDCPDPETFCEGPGRQYCPKGCMGRGTCVNNKCVCNSGYSGVDCALRA